MKNDRDNYSHIRENIGLGSGPKATVSMVMPEEYRQKIQILSKTEGRSMNNWIVLNLLPSIRPVVDQLWKAKFGKKSPEEIAI